MLGVSYVELLLILGLGSVILGTVSWVSFATVERLTLRATSAKFFSLSLVSAADANVSTIVWPVTLKLQSASVKLVTWQKQLLSAIS